MGESAQREASDKKRTEKRRGVLGLLLSAGIALKYGLLLLPKLKFFTTGASMLVSVGAYSFLFGVPFAVGLVLLLLVHEIGHVLAARREGIIVSAPMFVPFLGAAIIMREMPKDAAMEARIGLGGPLLGSLAALIPLAVWQLGGGEIWQALAYTGLLLNLFNLLPVVPLDGGRAMAAISTKFWLAGMLGLVGLTVLLMNPILALVCLFAGFESYRRFKARKQPETIAYHRVPARSRLLIGCTYVGLVAALGYGTITTHLQRDFNDIGGTNSAEVATQPPVPLAASTVSPPLIIIARAAPPL